MTGKAELCGQWTDSENTWITGMHKQTKPTTVSAGSNTDYGGFLFVGFGMETLAEIGRRID